MQMLNHLDSEYLTEQKGLSAAISGEITLFSANLGSKCHFFHAFDSLSQIILLKHNRKYLTEGIMSKLQKSHEIDLFWRF